MRDFDVVYVGDFRLRSDAVTRVVEEVLMNAHLGYRTGLAHVPSVEAAGDAVVPEILELTDSALATALDCHTPASAGLALLVAPLTTLAVWPPLPVRLIADRVVAILDAPAAPAMIAVRHRAFVQHFGDTVSWAASALDALARVRDSDVPYLGAVWRPFGLIASGPRRRGQRDGSPALIGAAAGAGAEHWPADRADFVTIWDAARYRVRVVGDLPAACQDAAAETLAPCERSPVRFASRLDAFVYYPDGRPDDLPLTAIGACLAAGIPVVLPRHLRHVIGDGPVYAAPHEVAAALETALAAPGTRMRFERAPFEGAPFSALDAHGRRMRLWLGPPQQESRRGTRTVLLVSSTGDDRDPVTRLLAIARKLAPDVRPVFASMSPDIAIIEDAGYHAELILSPCRGTAADGAADAWLRAEFAEIMDRHDPDAVVFDGGEPDAFLLDTMDARRRPGFVWIRDGPWRTDAETARGAPADAFFDAVVEPTDLDPARTGVRVGRVREARGDRAMVVNPIRLLDDAEQLPRGAARAGLGLNDDDPAVLIRLGPEARGDGSAILPRILAAFDAHPGVQIVTLGTPVSGHAGGGPGRITNAAIYPVSRYLRAFDFAVSAAGYTSVHELLTTHVPAIFVVPPAPEDDDCRQRAARAESMGLGFALAESDLSPLPGLVDRLLGDPDVGDTVSRNCRRLDAPNGAGQVADLVAEFAR